jgi:tetratricopeptide (TPR) repeat protein
MSCIDLAAYLDRRMPPDQGARFEDHLASCVSCQADVTSWETLHRGAAAWREDLQGVGPAATARLLESATAPPRRSMWIPLGLAAAVGLALLALTRAAPPLEAPGTAPPVVQTRPDPVPESPAPATAAPRVPELVFQEGSENTWSASRLVVPGDGRLVVSLGEHLLALGAGSSLELVQGDARTVRLSLERGEAAFSVAPQAAASSLELRAGPAVLRGSGSRFAVDLRDGLVVTVESGEVQVEGAEDRWVVRAGERLRNGRVSPASDRVAERLLRSGPAPAELVPEAAKPPPVPTFALALLKAQVARGELASAVPALYHRVAADPDDWPAWQLLAQAEARSSHPDEALAAWETVAAGAGGSSARRAHYQAAVILQDRSDPAAAVVHLLAWLDDSSGSAALTAEALVRLAGSYDALGQPELAQVQWRRVVDEHPGTVAAATAARHLD